MRTVMRGKAFRSERKEGRYSGPVRDYFTMVILPDLILSTPGTILKKETPEFKST